MLQEKSSRRGHEFAIINEDSWEGKHAGEIMDRNNGGGIIEEESCIRIVE